MKVYFSLMPHDNPGLAGDVTPAPLLSSILDPMEKTLSVSLLVLVHKEKKALLLNL